MARYYSIPPEAKRGFESIIGLNTTLSEEIANAINNSNIGDGPKKIAEHTPQMAVSPPTLVEINQAIFSMVGIFFSSNTTIETFTEDFINSYEGIFGKLPEENRIRFSDNLRVLIPSFSRIKHTIKAQTLLIENDNNFASAKIISDIRVVYNDHQELNSKEQYAIVLHHLKIIHYNETKEESESHFSLDISDLKKLQKIVNRAIEKDELIRTNNYTLTFVEPK